jgi:putative transposase
MIYGLYKTELIRPRQPWQTIEEVELAAAEWVHWFNHRCLYQITAETSRRSKRTRMEA